MNERIAKLYEEAGFPRFDIKNEAEKFAELIVRECGEVAFQQWCDNGEHESAQSAILNYFGVE